MKKVLIVEDQRMPRENMERILRYRQVRRHPGQRSRS